MPTGLPNTFVPGRNILFLTFAAALAYRRGIGDLVGGMCETDYSGYPDCRDATISAVETALRLGMDRPLTIHTPLMWIDKAATWRLAQELGGEALVALILEETPHLLSRRARQAHSTGAMAAANAPPAGFAPQAGRSSGPAARTRKVKAAIRLSWTPLSAFLRRAPVKLST